MTRLRKLVLQADDSSGLLGSACQRAAELYARACREGSPDGRKLARWLVKFRESSPGWPQLELADFVDALDDAALATYRRAVAKLDKAYADRDEWHRFEINRMLLELADHDQDLDRAVELLGAGEHPCTARSSTGCGQPVGTTRPSSGWIVRSRRAACRGTAAGTSTGSIRSCAATSYRSLGREADGISVLRAEFARRPELATFRQLLTFAELTGQEESERSWALATALELAASPYGSGALLVEIALADGDLETAWSAARDLGAGNRWRALADASRDFAPREAGDLYRDDVAKDLKYADTEKYRSIAERLASMRDLYERAGAGADFAEYIAELRGTYRRRTSLMSALDRERL